MISVKKISGLIVLLFLFCCNRFTKTVRGNQNPDTQQQTTLVPGREANMQTFLSKFKEIQADTFKVISSLDVDDEHNRFKGILLDSTDANLLPAKMAKAYHSDKRFYACFKFRMDDAHTGLIIRTPSVYAPSSLKLFVVNTTKNKIIDHYIELAETVIQMVEYWDKKTFIVKDKKSAITFLIWEHQNEDTTEVFYTIRFRDEKFDTLRVIQK